MLQDSCWRCWLLRVEDSTKMQKPKPGSGLRYCDSAASEILDDWILPTTLPTALNGNVERLYWIRTFTSGKRLTTNCARTSIPGIMPRKARAEVEGGLYHGTKER